MLFGETVVVYCENHTEHTDTVRTSQETHYLTASSDSHEATRQQQAIAKTPAKRSAYRIPNVTVVFVVPICKSHSQKPQEALNPLVTEERY
jgi:hypothetical protein